METRLGFYTFFFLRIYFSVNLPGMIPHYEALLSKIRFLSNHWNKRLLTPIGKITVVKTLAISKLVHMFISLPDPDPNFIKILESEFQKIIWCSKSDEMKRSIVIKKIMIKGFENKWTK